MKILYCHCAYAQVVPKAVKLEVLRRLTASGTAFDAVPDLCEMSARRDPALQRIAADGDVTIAACYPRAVKWLFHAAGAPLPDNGVELLNMRVASADEVVSKLLACGELVESAGDEPVEPASGEPVEKRRTDERGV